MEIGPREYYTHNASCAKDNFTELNDRGMKKCLDCAGMFNEDGSGVSLTDTRFDENWPERKAAGAGWNDHKFGE